MPSGNADAPAERPVDVVLVVLIIVCAVDAVEDDEVVDEMDVRAPG